MKFAKPIKFFAAWALVCLLTEVLPATAQMCLKSDCAALGYNNTVTACQNHFDILKCPFNTVKAVCGGEVKAVGSGVKMIYINGKLYSVTQGYMGGISYANASKGCTGKGYRLPNITEASRISNLRSQLGITVVIDYSGVSGGSSGLWTGEACSSGHMIFYLGGPSCKSDSQAVTGTICVKEL